MMNDTFEPDHEPIEGEIPEPRSTIRGSSKRKGKVQSCPVCPGRFTNVRRHAICSNLPWYTSPITACWTCRLQLARIRHSDLPSLTWEETERSVEIQFLIFNYCFPRIWQSSKDRQQLRKDSRLRFTFGKHPRMVSIESKRQIESWLADLEVLVEAEKVCAIGECGLNAQHASERYISRQVDVLDSQLQFAKV
ncbi:tatD [Mytilus coruscus]|uniref:TatD n=1 Tax=Mytilus coruscus TaxID=42192 RepID=A0A6J8B298_MYTCO|nr:tatD [Mytilus coruscus]